jgi:hypothetical protein
MYRLAIYFDAGADEAEELHDRLADLMREHTLAATAPGRVGYVLALAVVQQPEDDDDFVELVTEGAYRVLLGPAELLADE